MPSFKIHIHNKLWLNCKLLFKIKVFNGILLARNYSTEDRYISWKKKQDLGWSTVKVGEQINQLPCVETWNLKAGGVLEESWLAKRDNDHEIE